MMFMGRRLLTFFNCHNRMHSTLQFIEKQHKELEDEKH